MTYQPRVLFFCSWYPNRLKPFEGDFIQRHAQAIEKYAAIAVIYITKDVNLKGNDYELDYQVENGIKTIRVYYPAYQSSIKIIQQVVSGIRYLKALQKANTKIKEVGFEPQIVHSHILQKAAFWANRYAQQYHLPHIHSEHWSAFTKENGWYFKQPFWSRFFYKSIINKVDYTTQVSNYLFQSLQNIGLISPANSIISNTVNTKYYFPLANKVPNTKFRFIHISSFEKVKNCETILSEFLLALEKNKEMELYLIGGSAEKSMELKTNYSNPAISILDAMPYAGLAKELQQSDCLVLWSSYETQSCVALEALCCGVPIISSTVEGLRNVINTKNGLMLDSTDNHILSKTMLEIAAKKYVFNRHTIAQNAHQLYSFEAIGKQFYDCYQQLLEDNPSNN